MAKNPMTSRSRLDFDRYKIRDPIHGFISLSDQEIRIIDTTIFQRLRRIRQLAMAYLVYPGTTHTRFEHSLGVLHIAYRIAEQFIRADVIRERDIVPVRIAALLHDLGHGPFSHISEYVLAQHYNRETCDIEEVHEDITKRLIQNSPELTQILCSTLRDEVINVLTKRDIRKDITSGPLDADKLDYLLRDAYYAGVKYGAFDLSKILESMIAVGTGLSAQLGITEEGVHAVEQLIMAKHHMTVQVYRHRVRAITDAMTIRGIELAIRDGDKEMKQLYEYDGSDAYLKNYLEWWDEKVIHHILRCSSESARDVFGRLFSRRLFKLIHRRGINQREMEDIGLRSKFLKLEPASCREFEKEISKIEGCRCNPDHVILNIVTIQNPTYRSPAGRIGEDEIQVRSEKGTIKYLKDIPWSVMNLSNVEDKQQYVEVYAPAEKWANLRSSKKKSLLKKLDKEIQKILYKH